MVRLNPEVSSDLDHVICKALEKERDLRYQHASEMKADLSRAKRDSNSGRTEVLKSPAARSKALIYGLVGALAFLALGILAVLLWPTVHRSLSRAGPPSPITVAVLPFQNSGSDKDADFLRLALPDEIATTLSHSPALSIRPSATTSRYAGPDVDVQKAGREMQVADVVTGHYFSEGKQLQRRGQRWRTGCEGRISALKRRHGMRRCLYRGFHGMQRWVGLSVIADNVIQIGRCLALQGT